MMPIAASHDDYEQRLVEVTKAQHNLVDRYEIVKKDLAYLEAEWRSWCGDNRIHCRHAGWNNWIRQESDLINRKKQLLEEIRAHENTIANYKNNYRRKSV